MATINYNMDTIKPKATYIEAYTQPRPIPLIINTIHIV
jgi:hypothetical protein